MELYRSQKLYRKVKSNHRGSQLRVRAVYLTAPLRGALPFIGYPPPLDEVKRGHWPYLESLTIIFCFWMFFFINARFQSEVSTKLVLRIILVVARWPGKCHGIHYPETVSRPYFTSHKRTASHVTPTCHAHYCSLVWGFAARTHIDSLFSKQKKGIRAVVPGFINYKYRDGVLPGHTKNILMSIIS